MIGTKKKRGPVTGKALEKMVGTVGRIVIDTDGDGIGREVEDVLRPHGSSH